MNFSHFHLPWNSLIILTSLLVFCNEHSVKTEPGHAEIFSSYLFSDVADASQILYHRQMHPSFPFSSWAQRGSQWVQHPYTSRAVHEHIAQDWIWAFLECLQWGRLPSLSVQSVPVFGRWTGKFLTNSVILWYRAPLCPRSHPCPRADPQLRLPASFFIPSLML